MIAANLILFFPSSNVHRCFISESFGAWRIFFPQYGVKNRMNSRERKREVGGGRKMVRSDPYRMIWIMDQRKADVCLVPLCYCYAYVMPLCHSHVVLLAALLCIVHDHVRYMTRYMYVSTSLHDLAGHGQEPGPPRLQHRKLNGSLTLLRKPIRQPGWLGFLQCTSSAPWLHDNEIFRLNYSIVRPSVPAL